MTTILKWIVEMRQMFRIFLTLSKICRSILFKIGSKWTAPNGIETKPQKKEKNIQLYVYNVTVIGFSFHTGAKLQINEPSVYSWIILSVLLARRTLKSSNKCPWFDLFVYQFFFLSYLDFLKHKCLLYYV